VSGCYLMKSSLRLGPAKTTNMHGHYEHLKCGDIKGLLEVLHQRMTDRIKDGVICLNSDVGGRDMSIHMFTQ
jgi:hypothetical protein